MKSLFRVTVFALIDIISSCSLPAVKVGEITDRYSNEKSNGYLNLSVNYDKDKTQGYIDQLFDLISKNSEYAYQDTTFVRAFNSFLNCFNDVIDSITIYRTEYYASGDQEIKERYLAIYDDYLTLLSTYHDILQESYHSNYKEVLFGDMSDEEIEDLIASYDSNEETKEYTLKLEEYGNDAEEIYGEYYKSSEEYVDKMYDLLVKFIDVAKQYGNYLGEDYLDYIYRTDYSRDYKFVDVKDFISAIKTELVPAINVYKQETDKITISSSEQRFLSMLETYNFRYSEIDILPAIEEYVYSIEPLSNAYKNLWSDRGIYCFSNNDSSLGTAYTSYIRDKKQPLLYFSKNYQDAFTFIHEFGHYTSYFCNGGKNYPMDINEIDSIGNEMLFASFLLENHEKLGLSENLVKYLNTEKVYSNVISIINTAYVAEMEQIAYTYDLSDKAGFLRKIDEVCNSYGGYAFIKYWWAPAISNSGYYISYATSGIGALQFYVNSRSDYESATNKYSKFLKKSSLGETIDEITDSVGLKQIYSAEAVQYLAEYLKKIKL